MIVLNRKGTFMKNSYIRVVMNGKNEFRTTASLTFKGIEYSKVDVKIDTGCGYSSFPAKRLGISDFDAYSMKRIDSNDDSIVKGISFGVNDTALKRKEDKKKFRSGLYMDLTSITYKHSIIDFAIDEYEISDCDVRISYDRTGNILIGMDILKKLDTHIGTIETGETVLLACKKDNLSNEYRKELNSLFDVREMV